MENNIQIKGFIHQCSNNEYKELINSEAIFDKYATFYDKQYLRLSDDSILNYTTYGLKIKNRYVLLEDIIFREILNVDILDTRYVEELREALNPITMKDIKKNIPYKLKNKTYLDF